MVVRDTGGWSREYIKCMCVIEWSVVLVAVAVVCHAAPEYYVHPAEHEWMLTPLIAVKVTVE